jgi:hypothetical protein
MCTLDGRIDTELYTSTHQDELLAAVEFNELVRLQLTFKQENDPNDTSKKAPKAPNRIWSLS